MRTFEEAFEGLPPDERAEVIRLLKEALYWRGGGDGLRDMARRTRLGKIADVFARNGCEVMEYT